MHRPFVTDYCTRVREFLYVRDIKSIHFGLVLRVFVLILIAVL